MGHSCRTHMPQACTDWWKPVTTVCHDNASLYTYIPMEFIRPRQSTVVRPCSGYAWQPPGLRKELFDHNEATVSVNALHGLDRRLSFLQGKHQDVGRGNSRQARLKDSVLRAVCCPNEMWNSSSGGCCGSEEMPPSCTEPCRWW